MNTPATFKQVDVKRAVKAVSETGQVVKCVEITKEGTIRVLTAGEPTLENRPEPEL